MRGKKQDEVDGKKLLFADHIPRSSTCKRCIAKRVAVNGVNSNGKRRDLGDADNEKQWIEEREKRNHISNG